VGRYPDNGMNRAPDEYWEDDEFWAAFDEVQDYVPRTPWYRKVAVFVGLLFVVGMFATGALIPWGDLLGRSGNLTEPAEIRIAAQEVVAESPYGWLVEEIRVRNIPDSTTGAFVYSNPADGIITIDRISWNPDELRSTVSHEIGHLIDFAAYRGDDRRDGLGSEAWAECAAVDAGWRSTDNGRGNSEYHCTPSELEQYQFSVSLLGEICKTWGDKECRVVEPQGLDG